MQVMSTNTANILSRLSLAPAGSYVVYDAGSGWCFTAHMDELHEAHVADLAVGAHPYAAITLSHGETMEGLMRLTDYALDDVFPATDRRDGISLFDVLADWMDWCDDVIEDAAIRGRKYEGTAIVNLDTHAAIVDAMRNVGRITLADGDLAAINAAA
jgi:hypothetical protein